MTSRSSRCSGVYAGHVGVPLLLAKLLIWRRRCWCPACGGTRSACCSSAGVSRRRRRRVWGFCSSTLALVPLQELMAAQDNGASRKRARALAQSRRAPEDRPRLRARRSRTVPASTWRTWLSARDRRRRRRWRSRPGRSCARKASRPGRPRAPALDYRPALVAMVVVPVVSRRHQLRQDGSANQQRSGHSRRVLAGGKQPRSHGAWRPAARTLLQHHSQSRRVAVDRNGRGDAKDLFGPAARRRARANFGSAARSRRGQRPGRRRRPRRPSAAGESD